MLKVITPGHFMNFQKNHFVYLKILLTGFLFFALFIASPLKIHAQSGNWSVNYSPQKAFIENQGQFKIPGSDERVLYAYDGGKTRIYFTKRGISYAFTLSSIKEDDEDERYEKIKSVEEWKEKEAEELRMEIKRDVVSINWKDANANVVIEAIDPNTDYYSYCVANPDGSIKNLNYIKSFKKIVYKNIYPGIDVEYVFHPVDGLKYSLIIHPGADISKAVMMYSRLPKISDNGDIHISTKFGDIIDHAPVTFNSDNKLEVIASQFVKNGKSISFNLGAFDNSQTIVIDPWTQSPVLMGSNGVWECEQDGAGNIYIIGGDSPMKLLKYNALGALQWTYNTPWDTANNWLGTFATDLTGNSYVTSGSVAALQKVSTTGALQWTANAPLLSTDEYWNIAFNCDQTKLIIGGTTGNAFALKGAIFDVNTSNGSINSTQVVGSGNMFSFPPIIEEVRSITSCRNSRYYYLTLDSIGAIDDDFSICPTSGPTVFRMDNTYHFEYKSETYRPNNGNSGMMDIRANRYFVYSQNGSRIDKRSLADGSIITSATIPGGVTVTDMFGRQQCGNSGIDIDSCGNVYVGSSNGLYEFDADLNLITSIATTYKVSDVCVSSGGNVIFCGTTGTGSTYARLGTVQSANMGACPYMTLFCCNTNICPVNPICDTMPAFNLSVSQTGGIFSGQGIIDANLGTFDPATAGPGIHTISYSLACGTGTIDISVLHCGAPCPTFTFNNSTTPACIGSSSGTATVEVTNGTSPYVYALQDSVGNAVGTYVNVPGSQTFGGLPTGTYIIVCLDAASCVGSDTLYVGTSSNLTPTITGPDTICSGNTANLDAGPYANYLWSTGGTSQILQINTAGTYLVTVTDAGGCSGTATITVAQGNNLNPSITGILTICPGVSTTLDAGSGYANYNWSNGGTAQTITVSTGGTYTVTVSNVAGCTGSTSATVNAIQTPPVTASAQPTTICPGNPVTLTATGGQTYLWNTNPASTDSILTVNPIVTTTYQVTATYNGCTSAASVTVIIDSVLHVTTSTTNSSCGNDNGTATVNVSGPGYTYVWNTIPPQYSQTATGLGIGVYSVTVGYNGCSGIAGATVYSDPMPVAGFFTKPEMKILTEGPVTFYDQSIGNITTWHWDFGDSTSGYGETANHVYADTGTYYITLIVTDAEGCSDTAYGSIYIYPEYVFWIPNSFTPNGDEKNPVFRPYGEGIDTKTYSMIIYDRWGREFFSTNDINEGWNGTYQNKYGRSNCVQGSYVYLIKVRAINRRSYSYKGIVTLVM
jgi:gliding motility-associated-like protein